MEVVGWMVATVLWVIPTWRVLDRVGMTPALALLMVIPLVGGLIVLFLVAYGQWSRSKRQAGA